MVRKMILENTVEYLETGFLQKIEAFDLLTLNSKAGV